MFGLILSLFGFAVFTTGLALLSCLTLCFRVLFSIVITSLGEERAGLCASRAFVCLFCARQCLSFFLFLLVSRTGCCLHSKKYLVIVI